MKAKAVIFSACIFITFITAGCAAGDVSSSSHSSAVQESASASAPLQNSESSILPSSSVSSSITSSLPSSNETSVSNSTATNSSSSVPSSSTESSAITASDPDPFGLMGEGEVALFVVDSSTGKSLELNKTAGGELLSKIDFSKFTSTKMTQEITPPDAMVGEEGTAGNYISIGMRHTNMLYIYDTQTQALLTGAENKYFDITSDMYNKIKSVVGEY